jgi:hypothetical protein
MSLEKQKEMKKFFKLISPSLKQKIALVIFFEPLAMNALVKGMQK